MRVWRTKNGQTITNYASRENQCFPIIRKQGKYSNYGTPNSRKQLLKDFKKGTRHLKEILSCLSTFTPDKLSLFFEVLKETESSFAKTFVCLTC